ncbi:MAG: hypothetical protein QOC63_3417 [Mycobacterium sp.]|jgi:hypothetical protein|nr:hypothetical protein [Mycobacterium sp.]
MLMAGVMPEVFEASMRDVSGFAKSLGRRQFATSSST